MNGLGKCFVLIAVLFAATKLGSWFNQRSGAASSIEVEVSGQAASSIQSAGDSDDSALSAIVPLYMTYCSKCHGADGRGDPESMALLQPPPRDFSGSTWRFKKNHSEISRVIQQGIRGTAMPSMGHLLSDAETSALADYVLHLSEARIRTRPVAFLSDGLVALRDLGFNVYQNARLAAPLHLTSSDGTPFGISDTAGRITIVNFWGTTCGHCLEEMPRLAELQERYGKDGLLVLSVCADEDDLEVISKMAARVAPGHQVYADGSGLVTQKFSVGALPTFVIIDRQQKVIARRSGVIDWLSDEVQQAMRDLLGR